MQLERDAAALSDVLGLEETVLRRDPAPSSSTLPSVVEVALRAEFSDPLQLILQIEHKEFYSLEIFPLLSSIFCQNKHALLLQEQ